MDTIFTVLLTYLAIDAVLSLAVFFAFRRSTTLQSHVRFLGRQFFGIQADANRAESNFDYIEKRLNREIKNRQILKKRVQKMDSQDRDMDVTHRRMV